MEEDMRKNYKGHVLVMPYPAQGHINPMLQFAKRLASKGIKTTFATTHYTVNSICAPNVTVEPISDGFDESGYLQAKSESEYLESFRSNGSQTLQQLIRKYKTTDTPVVWVVCDSFLTWALEVAKKENVKGAAFFTNAVVVCSIYCYIHCGKLRLPLEREEMPLILPGQPPLTFDDLPTFLMSPESNPAYLAMKLSQFSRLEMADEVFVNSFEELEGEGVKGISELWPAKLIGPMVPSAYLDNRIKGDKSYGSSLWKPLTEDCIQWLDSKPERSVVYVSFGSMVSLSTKQVEEIAFGLKQSKHRFIWVVRETERKKLPQGYEESLNETECLLVPWCNQLEMLEHEATGCFVTHCGWNSTLEGLSLGVPMVGVPQWSDQVTDAKFLEEIWGVGVRAKMDEEGVVKREEVVRCLEEVMEGERSKEIRETAEKWRAAAVGAVGEGGSSDKCIDEFVGQVVSCSNGV